MMAFTGQLLFFSELMNEKTFIARVWLLTFYFPFKVLLIYLRERETARENMTG